MYKWPFIFQSYLNKSIKEVVWVEPVHTNSNLIEITGFMNDFPPGKSDHRNQQKNYINIINLLREQNKAGDWHLLSEKFKILKLQAQFQHWNEQAVIAHFATMKDQVNGILRKHFFPTHCEVSQKGIPRN